MARRAILVGLVGLIATSAWAAESTGEKTGVNSLLGVAPKTADFVAEAANSDMTEIAAAKIALAKGDANDKQFATQMVTDHTKTSDELKGLISSGAVQATLPTQMTSASQKTIADLDKTDGATFRSEYDSMQVSAHKSAISLFQRYADGGDNPKLKAWAQTTLPTLKHHLDMATALANRK